MSGNGNIEITTEYGKKNVNISVPFVLTLVLIFSSTIICTLLSGIMIYRNINSKINDRYNETTPLLYISSKIKSYDYLADGKTVISIGEIDGYPALIFDEEYDCVTYIYAYDGEMYELYMSADAGLGANQGNPILECPALDFYMNDNIITIALTAADGDVKKISVSLKCYEYQEGAAR